MPVIEYKESMPIGTIMAFPIDKIPSGWLICNGAEISRTTYKALFDVIGTTYGAGDGSTTFNLPDFQGKFLRGVGGNASNLGSTQGDAIRNIIGRVYAVKINTGTGVDGVFAEEDRGSGNVDDGGHFQTLKFRFDASLVVPTANENRPVNMAVVYCIKY
jgi:phage-related tail fiber protein